MLDIMQDLKCQSESLAPHERGTMPLECQDCLYHLNIVRLMNKPNTDLSIKHNQEAMQNRVIKHVHDYSLQEIFIYQKMLEAGAAQLSLIYNQKLVNDRVNDPANGWAQNPEKDKDPKGTWEQSIKQVKNANRPVAEKKQLTQFEKAVKSLTDLHIDEEIAIATVKERFAKQGKVTQ